MLIDQILLPELEQLKNHSGQEKVTVTTEANKKTEAPSKRPRKKKGEDAMLEEALPEQVVQPVSAPAETAETRLAALLSSMDTKSLFEQEGLVELGLKDLLAIVSGKKHKKKLDAELLDRLTQNKENLEALAALLTAELARPYFELASESAIEHILRIKTYLGTIGLRLEEIATLELKVELTGHLRNARDLVQSRCDVMQEEATDVARHILTLAQEAKEHIEAFDEPFDYGQLRHAKNQAVECARTLRIRDDNLRDALDKLETICWLIEALAVSAKKKTLSGVTLGSASELLERANKECRMAALYVSLSSNKPAPAVVVPKQGRKTGTVKESVEQPEEPVTDDPTELIARFFDQDEKHLLKPENCKDLIAKLSAAANHNKHTDKLVQLLQFTDDVLQRGSTDTLDQVVEMMFEYKLNTTKGFEYFSQLQKTLDKVNREVQLFASAHNKVQQTSVRGAGSQNRHRSVLHTLREETNDRLDVQRPRDVVDLVQSLPQGMLSKFATIKNELAEKVAAVDKFKAKLKEFRTKLQKLKPTAGKSEGIIADFEKFVKDYLQFEFTSDDLRRDLEKLLAVVKAFAILDCKSYDGALRHYEGWKNILETVKDFPGVVVSTLETKVKFGKSFMKMVDKIKSMDKTKPGTANPVAKIDRESLPNLLEAEDMLKQVQRHCKEIDFSTERSYVETWVNQAHAKLKSFGVFVTNQHGGTTTVEESQSQDEQKEDSPKAEGAFAQKQIVPQIRFEPPAQLMLHELQPSMDYFKRCPLNLKAETQLLSEIERKGLEFVQKVRELPSEQFLAKKGDLQHIYETLGVRVLEWDDMVAKAGNEQHQIQEISHLLKNKDIELQTIQDITKQYKHLEFAKDIRVEARIMLVYLQTLQREYERRQDIYVRDEVKPAIDFNTLRGLMSELDDLLDRIKVTNTQEKEFNSVESEINLKSDFFALSEHSKFLMELHNESRRHLDTEVYNRMLGDLDLSKIKSTFNKFVDLTTMILDYKTELEVRDRNKGQPEKPLPYKHKQPAEGLPNSQLGAREQKARLIKGQQDQSRIAGFGDQVVPGAGMHAPQVVGGDYYSQQLPKVGHHSEHEAKQDNTGFGHLPTGSQETIAFEAGAEGAVQNIPQPKATYGQHHYRDDAEHVLVKPALDDRTISEELRNYHRKNWKKAIESNPHLEIIGLDAIMISTKIEKEVYDKVKRDPHNYDLVCSSITTLVKFVSQRLQQAIGLKNFSLLMRNSDFEIKMLVYFMDKSASYLRKIDSGQAVHDPRVYEEITEAAIQRWSVTEFKLNERPRDTGLRKRNYNREGPSEEQPAKPSGAPRMGQHDKVVKATDNTGIVSYHLKPNPEYKLFSQAQQRPEEPRPQQRSQVPIRTEQRPFVAGGMLEEKLSYKNYSIFNGEFVVESEEGVIKQFDDVSLMTCSSFERTSTFSQIPNKLNLSVKIGKSQFQDYLTGIIENPQSYRILAGWVTHKKVHSVVSSYLQKHDVVASQQYTPNCKLFIFLVNSACHQWLDKLPIYTTTTQVEMVYFLVYKKRNESPEPLIRPAPIPISEETATVYRLVSSNNKIGFKASELSRIKETSRINLQQEELKLMAQVDGFFVDQGDDDDSQKPPKLIVQVVNDKNLKSNKLKSLIDDADRFKITQSYTIDDDNEHSEPLKKINHYEEDSDQEGLDGGDDDNLGNANFEDQESAHPQSQGSLEGSRGHRSHQVFGDRTNFAVPRVPQYSSVGINMDEFVRKAVAQIVISSQLVSSLPLPKRNPAKRGGKGVIKLGLGVAIPM